MGVPFPQVSGTNLERKDLSLPQDLEGQVNLLFVTFHQWHQREVNTWMPTARQLEADHPGLCCYELPIIRSQSRLAQAFINSGMRSGIPDPLARERTITLYLDKAPFRQTLDMPDEEHIYILLIDSDGQIRWRERGALTSGKRAALVEQIAQVVGESNSV